MPEKETQEKKYYFRREKAEESFLGSFGSFLIEIIKISLISLAIIIPVRYYLIQPFIVKGESMEPTLSSGDYLIIDEISYRFEKPKRGDIIVFRYPFDPSQYYIKRIIALPFEKIEIDKGGVFLYNEEYPQGVRLKEDYLPKDSYTPGAVEIKLDKDEYFVLGDNRRASSDSRVWGALKEDKIIGKSWIIGWPPNKIGTIKPVEYNLNN